MTTYHVTFPVVKRTTKFGYICSKCGKKRSKSITVEHTVNPFNKNRNGSVKSREEVARDVNERLSKDKAEFLKKPLCSQCG